MSYWHFSASTSLCLRFKNCILQQLLVLEQQVCCGAQSLLLAILGEAWKQLLYYDFVKWGNEWHQPLISFQNHFPPSPPFWLLSSVAPLTDAQHQLHILHMPPFPFLLTSCSFTNDAKSTLRWVTPRQMHQNLRLTSLISSKFTALFHTVKSNLPQYS